MNSYYLFCSVFPQHLILQPSSPIIQIAFYCKFILGTRTKGRNIANRNLIFTFLEIIANWNQQYHISLKYGSSKTENYSDSICLLFISFLKVFQKNNASTFKYLEKICFYVKCIKSFQRSTTSVYLCRNLKVILYLQFSSHLNVQKCMYIEPMSTWIETSIA